MLEEASCSSSDGGSEDEEIGEGGRHGGWEVGGEGNKEVGSREVRMKG